MEYTVTHHPERRRFETVCNGMTAFVEYRLVGNAFDIVHTVVPEAIKGRGIAGALTKVAYEYARKNGLKPEATCPYSVAWLQKHPEYTVEE